MFTVRYTEVEWIGKGWISSFLQGIQNNAFVTINILGTF